jgi:hypothetical protein
VEQNTELSLMVNLQAPPPKRNLEGAPSRVQIRIG